MIKRVTLSDGSRVQVALPERGPGVYYPDAPHCVVCDRREPEVQLRPCTSLVYAGGHRYDPCGRFLCTNCCPAEERSRVCCSASGPGHQAHCPHAR